MPKEAKVKTPEQSAKESDRIVSRAGGGSPYGDIEKVKLEDIVGEDVRVLDFEIATTDMFKDEKGNPKPVAEAKLELIERNNKVVRIVIWATTVIGALRGIDKATLPRVTKIDRARSKNGRNIYVLS
jgi:Flp pilus assembly protein CpaB